MQQEQKLTPYIFWDNYIRKTKCNKTDCQKSEKKSKMQKVYIDIRRKDGKIF